MKDTCCGIIGAASSRRAHPSSARHGHHRTARSVWSAPYPGAFASLVAEEYLNLRRRNTAHSKRFATETSSPPLRTGPRLWLIAVLMFAAGSGLAAGFFSNPGRVASLWPTKPLPVPLWETEDIGAVFQDDFNRTDLGTNWVIENVSAALVGGELLLLHTNTVYSRRMYYWPWLILLRRVDYTLDAAVRSARSDQRRRRRWHSELPGAGRRRSGVQRTGLGSGHESGQNAIARV